MLGGTVACINNLEERGMTVVETLTESIMEKELEDGEGFGQKWEI